MAPHWKDLAPQLGLSGYQVRLCETPVGNKKDETQAMFQKWTDAVVEHTWRKLIEALRMAGLTVLANDLTNALSNMDPK